MKKKIIGISLVIILITVFTYLLFYNSDYQPDKVVELPFKVNNSKTKLIFFFGYVGCPEVCPVSLSAVGIATREVKDDNLQVIFFGLSDTTQTATDNFAKVFDKNFRGIKLKKNEQRKLIESFNVFWSPERKKIKREASHSPYLYFLTKINNKWILKNVSTQYPPKKEDIIKLIENL